jgi:large subunit ribosomal protein L6
MLSLNIPKKITIKIFEDWIFIEGPLGCKKKKKSKDIQISIDSKTNKLWLSSTNISKNHFHLAILNKIIWGVLKGFCMKLNIIGVGYKAFVEQNQLILKLGFSHNIIYKIPQDITIKILNQKLLTLLILGNDFQKVNQTAAEIRALKPAEPYKGKGIKYFNEIVRRKEGKKTNV